MSIQIERVYSYRDREKGASEYVALVDRLWPRGLSKEDLDIDEWAKDLAPSGELRKRFGHDPGKWPSFVADYRHELEGREGDLEALKSRACGKDLTLLYSAKDETRNQATALRAQLDARYRVPGL